MGRKLGALSAAGVLGALAAWWKPWSRCCDATIGAWTTTPTWGPTGHMTNVAVFRDFVTDQRPCWRHYPVSASFAAIGVDPRAQSPIDPVVMEATPGAGSGEVDVTLVFEHHGDDSVAATRYRFTYVDEEFVDGTPGVYRLLEAMREFRCQPGRGQQDWGPDLCL